MERLVECVVEDTKSSTCDTGTKPAAQASCNLGQCPQWKIGEWTEVSTGAKKLPSPPPLR